MNFIFDNCISPRIAHAIKSLADADGDAVSHIKDRFVQNVPDSEWIENLGAEGGWVVISGDIRILKNPHERRVWQEAKLIGFFFGTGMAQVENVGSSLAFGPQMACD